MNIAEKFDDNLTELRIPVDQTKINDHWPDIAPDPENSKYPPLPEFPLDAMPEVLGNQAVEAAACYQVPIEFPAACALSVAGIAIGGNVIVSPKNGVIARPNLYVICFLASGERKSSVFPSMIQPIQVFQREHAEEWERIKEKIDLHDRRKDELIKQLSKHQLTDDDRGRFERKLESLKQTAPVGKSPFILCENSTEEALVQKMATSGGRAAVFSAEARDVMQVITGLYDPFKNNRETVYLKGYDGDSITYDRVKRHYHIDNPCIGMCLCLQLDKLCEIGRNKGLSESGFIPRILPVIPDSLVGTRFFQETVIRDQTQQRYNDLILGFLEQSHNGTISEKMKLEPDAKRLWIEFYDIIERDLKNQYQDRISIAMRYPSLALRFALIVAKCEEHSAINAADVTKALMLTEYFMIHGERAGVGMGKGLPGNLGKIISYIRERKLREFSSAKLRRGLHAQSDEFKLDIGELTSMGYLRFKNLPPGTNVTPIYESNPQIWDVI